MPTTIVEVALEQVRKLIERKVVPARWLAADALWGLMVRTNRSVENPQVSALSFV